MYYTKYLLIFSLNVALLDNGNMDACADLVMFCNNPGSPVPYIPSAQAYPGVDLAEFECAYVTDFDNYENATTQCRNEVRPKSAVEIQVAFSCP